MITLSDEILNKYLDGELSKEIMTEIENTISKEDRAKLTVMKDIDRSLKDLKITEPKSNFTSIVMERIQRSIHSRLEQKKFIISIISVFILMCLVVLGVIGFEIIGKTNPWTPSALRDSIKYITSAAESITNIFNSRNLTIIGGVFSFGLIISAWFFFDYSKMLRKAGK
jgi:hypothetical protein